MKKVLILLFQFCAFALMIINAQNKIVLSNTNIIDGISMSEKKNMMVRFQSFHSINKDMFDKAIIEISSKPKIQESIIAGYII